MQTITEDMMDVDYRKMMTSLWRAEDICCFVSEADISFILAHFLVQNGEQHELVETSQCLESSLAREKAIGLKKIKIQRGKWFEKEPCY